MFFYLMRHGDKIRIPGNPGLSDLGKSQSKLTAIYLMDKNISAILSSQLARVRETARIISKRLGMEFKEDKRLTERINWGDVPNVSFSEFLKEWEKTDKDRDYKPKFGQSSRETGNKLLEVIKEFEKEKESQNILIVTSGGTITDLLRNIFGDDYLESKRSGFIDGGIKDASITILQANDGNYKLIEFASTKHLKED